jgi:inner membrane protein
LGRAGFNRKTALATLTMTLAAEAPDLDIATIVKGRVFYFAHHRGFTHSFLGLILVSLAVLALVYGFWRIRGRKLTGAPPPRWGLLFVFAYIAGLSHILLDFTNSYGVRPFWPFSEQWYSWDIEFIVEPVLLILLVGGLVLPKLFSLINDEIGARRKGLPGRFAASVALVVIVLFWGLRDYEHRRAVNALDARTYGNLDAIRTSAYPDWLNPFRWIGVVETDNFFATMEVNSISPEVDPQGQMRVHYKPPETPVTIAAKKSYLGRVYLDWAKYPITETETLESPPGYLVRFKDLRYDYPAMRSRSTLSATVQLDSNLGVVQESSGSTRAVAAGKP